MKLCSMKVYRGRQCLSYRRIIREQVRLRWKDWSRLTTLNNPHCIIPLDWRDRCFWISDLGRTMVTRMRMRVHR